MYPEGVACVEHLAGFVSNLSIRCPLEKHLHRASEVRIALYRTQDIAVLYRRWDDEHLTVDLVS